MTDLSLTIRAEIADDELAIERLHERTFGPGRYAKTAYRLREGRDHSLDLSFTARVGTLLVGSVRLTPVRIGETKALLLGPLTVEPPFRDRGIGQVLIERSLAGARAKGHRLVVPGPVDPARLLVCELVEGAFENVSGPLRPEWESEHSA
jgi:predicted N-acetyltransferase YhbS